VWFAQPKLNDAKTRLRSVSASLRADLVERRPKKLGCGYVCSIQDSV